MKLKFRYCGVACQKRSGARGKLYEKKNDSFLIASIFSLWPIFVLRRAQDKPFKN